MVHSFASRCPFFTVFDADEFLRLGGTTISCTTLSDLGFHKAASWLREDPQKWTKFLPDFEKERENILKVDGKMIHWKDDLYPARLRNLFHPPAFLFYRGDLEVLRQLPIAVVGSRHPTDLGRQWVRKNIPEMVKLGMSIVSGGARGIDYEAHHAAIMADGKTVAFLPGGVLNPYPRSHDFLFKNILDKGGLLISEFVSEDAVRKENFHQRNRLIAGCAAKVIIVEAAPKSGTMMTAKKASDENREVFVVPGSPMIINYAGSLDLICQGANVIRDVRDMFKEDFF